MKPTKEPAHGQICGLYAVVYDQNLHKKIIIPINRADILRGRIKLP